MTSLLPADSPRQDGENVEHIRLLAAANELPAILVHRPTMRIIDGMHRVRAALIRGDHEVPVEYFDGTEMEAFVWAVRANVTHGLPLSRRDREAAAKRIIQSHPYWSDRAIAEVTGLSAPTIATIRGRTTESGSQMNMRMGRDGRLRPIDSSDGRRRASEIIQRRPEASLREIARAAGIATGTARDVRERMRRGESPVPSRFAGKEQRAGKQQREEQPKAVTPPNKSLPGPLDRPAAAAALHNLRRDPSLRYTNTGRSILQWLGIYSLGAGDEKEFVRSLPEHCRQRLADLAWGSAEIWRQIAQELEQRAS